MGSKTYNPFATRHNFNQFPKTLQSTPGDVPTAVHNLLASTKKLQEALKLWSVEQTAEADVSDIYVLIVHQFNEVISAFDHYRISIR